jgi:hypothetical protein
MEDAESSVKKFMTSEFGLLLEALLALGAARYLGGFEVMVMAGLAFVISNVFAIKLCLEKH